MAYVGIVNGQVLRDDLIFVEFLKSKCHISPSTFCLGNQHLYLLIENELFKVVFPDKYWLYYKSLCCAFTDLWLSVILKVRLLKQPFNYTLVIIDGYVGIFHEPSKSQILSPKNCHLNTPIRCEVEVMPGEPIIHSLTQSINQSFNHSLLKHTST